MTLNFRNTLFVSASLSCSLLFSQKLTVHFEGTVYDEENAAMKGALVEVKKDSQVYNFFKADEQGNYNVYLPLNGDYDITISKPGYVQKKYSVSTKDIPEDKSNAPFASNVADVVLFTKHDNIGLDYGLFERPMNKYAYDPSKDNIRYDEAYLKEMKLAVKEFKKLEAEAIRLAKEKAKADKLEAEKLALEKAKQEKLQQQQALADARQAQDRAIKEKLARDLELEMAKKVPTAGTEQTNIVGNITVEQKKDKTIVSTNSLVQKSVKDPAVAELLSRYKPGVTEEVFESKDMVVIQRVVVRDENVWIYKKKIFNWGGVSFFRDKDRITEGIFEQETQKPF